MAFSLGAALPSGSPVQTLSTDHLDRCRTLKLGSQLCRILRSAHQAGWVNRDVRLCNMVLAPPRRPNAAAGSSTAVAASGTDPSSGTGPQWIRPPWPRVESSGGATATAPSSSDFPSSAAPPSPPTEDLDVYLIDWGTASWLPGGPALYEGGLRYASRRLLLHFSGALQVGQHLGVGGSALRQQQFGASTASRQLLPVEYTPADDLVSLVKSMFALRHPDFRRQLEGTPSEDFDGIAGEALQLWDMWLGEGRGRPQ